MPEAKKGMKVRFGTGRHFWTVVESEGFYVKLIRHDGRTMAIPRTKFERTAIEIPTS